MKFSVRISDNDYGYRMEQAKRFLAKRMNVLVMVQFKGREITHPELGEGLIRRLLRDLGKTGKPLLRGKSLQILLTP